MNSRRLIAVAAASAFVFLCHSSQAIRADEATKAPAADAALQNAIHDYILAHPEVLIQSLRMAKQREESRRVEQNKALIASLKNELVADPSTPVRGNPAGDATLIEFFDYRCPYCRQVEPFLQAIIKHDPGVRIIEKEFPILGPASVYAARMAIAAYKQGKHEQFHDAVIAKKPNIDEATLLKLAGEAGLDLDRLKADMYSPDVDAEIARTAAIAKTLKLNGTPAFIVGSELVPGATDLPTLQALLDEARHETD